MLTKRILIAAAAVSVTLGSFGLGASIPAEAATMKHAKLHPVAACTKHWVRLSKDKWTWTCGVTHPKHHKVHHAVKPIVKNPVTKKHTK